MTIQQLSSATLLADGGRLLAAVAGDSRITFQTFDDTGRGRKKLARVFHGTLAEHAAALAELNRIGASVNFMVNEGDGRGRTKHNVTTVRAIFVDLDGAPLEPVLTGPLRPHATVQSSPGKFHAYWFVDGVRLEDFTPLQRSIAAQFDGDKAVSDLARVMRLPGSLHCKREPVLCELLDLRAGPRYSRAECIEAFGTEGGGGPLKEPRLRVLDGTILEGDRNSTLFQLARGFVNKGFDHGQVLQRIQAVNARKCVVPLCATEVDAIVASAVRHGPSGFLNLPLCIFDSEAYRDLSHPARTLAAAAYRRYNGRNNGDIALAFSEFQREFTRSQSFYSARRELVDAGLLRQTRRRSYVKGTGWRPELFEVALQPPAGPNGERSAVN